MTGDSTISTTKEDVQRIAITDWWRHSRVASLYWQRAIERGTGFNAEEPIT